MPGPGATVIDDWAPPAGARCPRIEVGAPDPTDGRRWFRVADLADPAGGILDCVLAEMATNRGYSDGHSQGGGLSLLTAGAALEVVLRTFGGDPLPVLRPGSTWFQVSPYGNATAVRVESRETTSPSVAALRAILRGLLAPFYAAIHARTGFPVVAQWAQLESNIAYSMLGAPDIPQVQAVEFLDRLFADGDVLHRARPRISWVERRGAPLAFVTRRVCCFNFRGMNGEYCGSQCPIVPAPERARRAIDD
ncbi:MAG: hypothetical protein GEU80_09500 [Dehalococcoidia bacterium]|nr:hypothetical protein [Dehalococcoidia bacterium]